MVARLVLGITESGIMPCYTVMMSMVSIFVLLALLSDPG